MIIHKAYKFRIYPNYEQYGLIMQNMGSSRFIYNHFLKLKDEYYQETKTNLSLKTMKQKLVEMKNTKEYEFLKQVDSMALTNSLEFLDNAYTNFFEGRSIHPVFKIKGSNNYKKLKNKIARLYQKIRNMRKYYIHEITDKLTKENDVIITETLKVKEMIISDTSSKSLRRRLTNASLFELERQLVYKTK